jgi:membrane protein implicated in regulation of membrane protease activity
MEWSLTHFWLILALALSLAELTSGVLLLLALGVAAALTALVASLGASFEWQLVAMGVLSGILVPVAILWIRPRFSPKGVAYGTTGTGVMELDKLFESRSEVNNAIQAEMEDAASNLRTLRILRPTGLHGHVPGAGRQP